MFGSIRFDTYLPIAWQNHIIKTVWQQYKSKLKQPILARHTEQMISESLRHKVNLSFGCVFDNLFSHTINPRNISTLQLQWKMHVRLSKNTTKKYHGTQSDEARLAISLAWVNRGLPQQKPNRLRDVCCHLWNTIWRCCWFFFCFFFFFVCVCNPWTQYLWPRDLCQIHFYGFIDVCCDYCLIFVEMMCLHQFTARKRACAHFNATWSDSMIFVHHFFFTRNDCNWNYIWNFVCDIQIPWTINKLNNWARKRERERTSETKYRYRTITTKIDNLCT